MRHDALPFFGQGRIWLELSYITAQLKDLHLQIQRHIDRLNTETNLELLEYVCWLTDSQLLLRPMPHPKKKKHALLAQRATLREAPQTLVQPLCCGSLPPAPSPPNQRL